MSIADSTQVKVRNMVDYNVGYKIEEDNVRRQFSPHEVKTVTAGELRKLDYTRGGHVLLTSYLAVQNKSLAQEFGVDEDSFANEYNWDAAKVDQVLLSEPVEVLQDAMDFAPEGILQLIKDRAIALRLDSMDKRKVISDAMKIDLNGMIELAIKAESTETKEAPKKTRRTSSNSTATKTRRAVAQE